jgi:hypothetical protein
MNESKSLLTKTPLIDTKSTSDFYKTLGLAFLHLTLALFGTKNIREKNDIAKNAGSLLYTQKFLAHFIGCASRSQTFFFFFF